MANFNKVILLGNLTRDLETRYTQGAAWPIAKFGLAVNRKATTKDGEESGNDVLRRHARRSASRPRCSSST